MKFEGSNHRPIISTFDSKRKKPLKLFRYDRRKRDNEEIKLLVSKVWDSNNLLPVAGRIGRCKHAISRWRKEHYVNSQKLINELKLKLDIAMANQDADDAYLSFLNKSLIHAYKSEEDF